MLYSKQHVRNLIDNILFELHEFSITVCMIFNAESKVNRLKMGHSLLKQHIHRIAMIDNPTIELTMRH